MVIDYSGDIIATCGINMKIEYATITMTPLEFQAKLTGHSHEMIKYLVRKGYLTDEDKAHLELAFSGERADDRKEWLGEIRYFERDE